MPKNPLSLLSFSLDKADSGRREREDPGPRRASSKAYSRPLGKGRGGGEGGGASVGGGGKRGGDRDDPLQGPPHYARTM